ncbi:MAG TPA: BlaI/MecI/CopY family transcriptional regulator [Pirellulaceae bacterium]|nr:BlaI/MecI/CopY family transcriptional regulator [Pirellulaceae bacterium]
MAPTRLGKVQLKIMSVLWERGSATAREITEQLSADQPIAHSTVQTLLRGLMDKGAVKHVVEGRTFVFQPTVAEDKVRHSAMRDLLSQVFDGSVSELVAFLLKHEHVSRRELDEIKRMIEDKTRRKS